MKKLFKNKLVLTLAMSISAVAVFSAGAFAATGLEKIQAYKNHAVSFSIDNKQWIPVGDDGKELAAITFENRTYIPLRSGFEKAGFDVQWDNKNQKVVLTTPGNEPPAIEPGHKPASGGSTPTPTTPPTPAKSPVTQPTTPPTTKVVLKADTYVSLFNGYLAGSGLSSDFAIDAAKLQKDQPTPDVTNYMFTNLNPLAPSDNYIMMAGTKTTTGEITAISFTIHGGIVKDTMINAITAFVQDAKLGKAMYDRAGLSKIVDDAIANGSQAPTQFSDSGYVIRYVYYGQGQNHVVSISNQ